MQFERFYSLNICEVVWFAHLHHLDFWLTLPNLGKRLCGGSGVNVNPYVYTQQLKVLKHLISFGRGASKSTTQGGIFDLNMYISSDCAEIAAF